MQTVPCSSCAAPIGFVKLASDRSMPVDPEIVKTFAVEKAPYARAKRLILVTESGAMAKGFEVSLTHPGAESVEGYVPHWSTCTDPKAHRRT